MSQDLDDLLYDCEFDSGSVIYNMDTASGGQMIF